MRIREYTEADLEPLRRIHASQGFDYAFPDLRDPIFVSKLVLEDDAGRVVMASLARLTCEMYLLMTATQRKFVARESATTLRTIIGAASSWRAGPAGARVRRRARMAAAAHRQAVWPQACKAGLDPRRHVDTLLFSFARGATMTTHGLQKSKTKNGGLKTAATSAIRI